MTSIGLLCVMVILCTVVSGGSNTMKKPKDCVYAYS